ncbi:MAG TPA: creatininase family protein [Gemmatimonadaceae bacterium]|nr:creatininase family protein [Gemmatimonadaceae bacterium]
MTAALRAVAPAPRRLKEMTPAEVAALVAEDPRLIVPVGSCEPRGPHLPIGGATIIVERLADDLSAAYGVLRAPAVEYGVSRVASHPSPGDGTLQRKTLHRVLNDLIAGWERTSLTEFILLSANDHDLHQEALLTLVTHDSRVRVADLWAVPIADLLAADPGPLPGGEAETALLLHLAPSLVRQDLAVDHPVSPEEFRRYRAGRLRVPDANTGALGMPRAASALTGRAIYERLRQRIGQRLFLSSAREG